MISQQILIDMELSDDMQNATIQISVQNTKLSDLDLSRTIMIATEHLMTQVCVASSLSFEGALKILCDNARSNEVEVCRNMPPQGEAS